MSESKGRFSIAATDTTEGEELTTLEALGSIGDGEGHVGVDCQGLSLQVVLDKVKAWREGAPSRGFKFFNFQLPDIFVAMGMGPSAATSMLREVAKEAAPSYAAASQKSFAAKMWDWARGLEATPETDMVIQLTIGNIENTFTATVADIPKPRGRKKDSEVEAAA